MEKATQAQIDYLTKLQAEYLKDQAEGFYTQYSTLDEYIANQDWTFTLADIRAEDTRQALSTRQADPEWAKAQDAADAEIAATDFAGMTPREARRAKVAISTRHTAHLKAREEERIAAELHARQASKWETSKAINAAAHTDLTGISKAEASALIDLLK